MNLVMLWWKFKNLMPDLLNLIVEVNRRALNVECPLLVRGRPERYKNKPTIALFARISFLRRHVYLMFCGQL
jgi:hypothetical protein